MWVKEENDSLLNSLLQGIWLQEWGEVTSQAAINYNTFGDRFWIGRKELKNFVLEVLLAQSLFYWFLFSVVFDFWDNLVSSLTFRKPSLKMTLLFCFRTTVAPVVLTVHLESSDPSSFSFYDDAALCYNTKKKTSLNNLHTSFFKVLQMEVSH